VANELLLLEHEGKAVLREYGIPTPKGAVVLSGREAPELSRGLVPPLIAKVQVPAGARGKAGGIRSILSDDDLETNVRALLETAIRGHTPVSVLVEEKVAIARERYLGIMLHGAETRLLIGRQGGVDVEGLVDQDRSSIAVVPVRHGQRPDEDKVIDALLRLDIAANLHPTYIDIVMRLAALFIERDAVLAEINPLAELTDGTLRALDARIAIDGASLFRQPQFNAIAAARAPADPRYRRMRELEVQYVPIGGSIGLVSSGAGLGVTLMDWVVEEGQRLAAFVDLDYSIMSGKAEPAMRLVFDLFDSDPQVRSIIVNFTSCGLRLDAIANELVKVMKARPAGAKPTRVHLQGNRAAEAHRLLRAAQLDLVETLGDTVRQAADLAREVAA
jgi:succinyl-CoA synthetase beta subunit